MRRPTLRGIRLRLALALLTVVAGSLGVVYLIVVPSLESELVNNKLNQLEEDAQTVARNYAGQIGSEQEFAEGAAALFQARVVVYSILQNQPFIFGDSNTTSSLDVARDPTALRSTRTRRLERGTVERGDRRFAEVAVPVEDQGVVILLSDSLNDPISSLNLIERRLLYAGLLALLFAVVVGYGAASLHARRIRRLERAAERIASGHFDEPVIGGGDDELGDLATAFERMRVRLAQLDRARSEFIANASHELRTPLFSLGGFLELMADEVVDDATRQEFLETMREQVDRLAKLATDLLDLSR
ncbi:MAG: HAMP domain-containing protein, partial [Thermoleophilia bacterium]|nr:HAMP domain-containing protein [Thermoleophilia bacterium]